MHRGALIAGCILALAPALAAAWKVQLEPVPVRPGTVLICRVDAPAPSGMVLAGFQQEAGFYRSGGAFVALLAVPLGQAPGRAPLSLRWADGIQSLSVRVAKDAYPRKRVRRIRGLKKRLASPQAAEDKEALEEASAESHGPPRWSGPFRWPLNPPVQLTSPFGSLRSYNKGQAAWRHKGLDLRAPVGTPVLAAADGEVLLAKPSMTLSGGTVLLGHGYGVTSSYYHLDSIEVRAGSIVHAGEPIGSSGASGLASGPHLHWQVELRGHPVDPKQWLGSAQLKEAAPQGP